MGAPATCRRPSLPHHHPQARKEDGNDASQDDRREKDNDDDGRRAKEDRRAESRRGSRSKREWSGQGQGQGERQDATACDPKKISSRIRGQATAPRETRDGRLARDQKVPEEHRPALGETAVREARAR